MGRSEKTTPLPFLLFFSIGFLALSGLMLWVFLSTWIHRSTDSEITLDFNIAGEAAIERYMFPLFAGLSCISVIILVNSLFKKQIRYSSGVRK